MTPVLAFRTLFLACYWPAHKRTRTRSSSMPPGKTTWRGSGAPRNTEPM